MQGGVAALNRGSGGPRMLVFAVGVGLLAGCAKTTRTAEPRPSPSSIELRVDSSDASTPSPGAQRSARPGSPIRATLPDAAGVEVVSGAGGVWVAGPDELLRIDPANNRVVKKIDVGGLPTQLGISRGAVWATTFRQGAATLDQELVRVDPATDAVTARIRAGDVVQDLAADDTGLWMLIGGDLDRPALKLVHVDSGTGRVAATIPLKLSSLFVRVVSGPEGAFVMSGGKTPTLTHVRPENRVGAAVALPALPSGGMIYSSGAVWLVSRDKSSLTKVDAKADRVVGTYPLPPLPAYLAEGGGRIWVTIDPVSVVPIDPATGAAGPVLTVDQEAAKDPNTEKRIKALAVDPSGLWLVTGVGAWRVNVP
jgi:hypothetical protein